MTKVLAFIPRRTDIPLEEFHEHWRTPHGELTLNIKPLRRYVQNHRVDDPQGGLEDSIYEGIAEVWFDDLATAQGLGEDPDYLEYVHPDEPLFIDLDRLAFLIADEVVLTDDTTFGKDDDSIKLLQMIADADGVVDDERATALGARLGVARHGVCRPSAETYAADAPPFQGIRELWWTDRAAYDAARAADPEAWDELMGAATTGAGATALLAEEHRVLWP